jgi:hypothetical protein
VVESEPSSVTEKWYEKGQGDEAVAAGRAGDVRPRPREQGNGEVGSKKGRWC